MNKAFFARLALLVSAVLALAALVGCGSGNTFSPERSATGPDFTLSVTPASRTVAAGSSASFTVTATTVNGFESAVTISGPSSGLPVGMTIAPVTVTPSSAGAQVAVAVATTGATPTGSTTITLTGTGGGQTHTVNVTVNVTAVSGSFTVSLNPDTVSLGVGWPQTIHVTVTPSADFSGTVLLSCDLPHTWNPTFDQNQVTFTPGDEPRAVHLTVTGAYDTAWGTYPFVVRGDAGGENHAEANGTAELVAN